jgi:hypothetical protein
MAEVIQGRCGYGSSTVQNLEWTMVRSPMVGRYALGECKRDGQTEIWIRGSR